MVLGDLIKLKAFKLKCFLLGNGGRKRNHETKKKLSYVKEKRYVRMMPMNIAYGYHVVEHHVNKGGSDDSDFDSVVIQKEQMDDHTALWYFGIFDSLIGDGVTNYMQSHFFNKKLKQSQMRRKTEETFKRAYLRARTTIREEEKSEEACRMGSTSVMVINGEKLVIANMGDYRTVLCRDGVAYQKAGRHNQSAKRHWYYIIFSGNTTGTKHCDESELVVRGDRIKPDTEFLILASNGIWEVMKNQEAVNLIRHIEDPQEAAECLGKEALIRISKSNISCLIIRFDYMAF